MVGFAVIYSALKSLKTLISVSESTFYFFIFLLKCIYIFLRSLLFLFVTAVTEKTFTKEDEILANIDKSYSKDENTFAKKIPDISEDSKPPCPKEDKEINEEKESEKEKSDANSSSKNEASNEEKKVQSSEAEKDETEKPEKLNDLAKNSESCTEAKNDDEKSKFSEKIVEEESTLGNDSFPKDKTEADHVQSEDKSDAKTTPDKADKKSDDLAENNEDDNLDEVLIYFIR